jgi:hypothetical protein
MQNERHDADRFANQLTLRNRMFRNYAQDVPWEWAEMAEGWEGPECGAQGWAHQRKARIALRFPDSNSLGQFALTNPKKRNLHIRATGRQWPE